MCKVKGKFPEKAQKTVFKLNDDSILTEFSSVSEEEQQMMRENFAGVRSSSEKFLLAAASVVL